MSSPSVPARPPLPLMVVAGLFLASLAMRPQLLAIGPLLPLIRADLGLSATDASVTTALSERRTNTSAAPFECRARSFSSAA